MIEVHDYVNELISGYHGLDKSKVSDGYHTFGELYDHRIQLWITVCKLWLRNAQRYDEGQLNYFKPLWRTKVHSDGSTFDGWFLLGISKYNLLTEKQEEQLTYHLPISKWDECNFAYTLDKAPEYDGHTSVDVLERLKTL